MELWNLPLSGLSERVTAHVHIPKSRLQEMFLACSYTLCREMNFILWMQSTGNFFKCQIIFSCKQERWKWAASARSCVLSWEARSHQQITQVRSIFRGNTEYSLPPDMVQYTVKLLGLKISRTLKPIITRKSRYINYSIIWHVAFFHQSLICRCPFQFTPLKKGSPCNTVFPVLDSTGSLSATARRGFPDRKLPTEGEGQEMASDVPYRLVKWHDSGKYKIRRSVALSFS